MGPKARITSRRQEVELTDESRLPKRRGQVLRMAASGMSTSEIAIDLGVSISTIEWHMNELKDQLCAYSRADMISQGWMHGLLRARSLAFILLGCALIPAVRSRPAPVSNTRPPVVRTAIGRNQIRSVFA